MDTDTIQAITTGLLKFWLIPLPILLLLLIVRRLIVDD